MAQTLPEGAAISAADMDRIVEGLVELQVGKKAHAVLKVQVDLNFHHAYPKFVEFQGSSKIVQSEAEEMAFLSAVRLLDVPALPELPSAADLNSVSEDQEAAEAKLAAQFAYVQAMQDACQRNAGKADQIPSISGQSPCADAYIGAMEAATLVESEAPTTDAEPSAVLTDEGDSADPSVVSEPEKV